MAEIYKHRLLLRVLTLGVLTLCLSLLSRSGSNAPLASVKEPQLQVQTQAPVIAVKPQVDTPLLIAAPRIISWDGQDGEFAYELINASGKPIRAYAIMQRVEAGSTQSSSISFSNLDLTSSPSLQPNQSLTDFDTCPAISEKERQISLSVDYVEFSDGTKWGKDTAKSAERSAGQRAAASLISKRLLKILNEGDSSNVMSAIEAGAAHIEPPAGHSDEWKEGFRNGSNSVVARLKSVQKRDGSRQFEQKLRQLAERFKGVD